MADFEDLRDLEGLMAARETVDWEKKALSWIQAAATALMIV